MITIEIFLHIFILTKHQLDVDRKKIVPKGFKPYSIGINIESNEDLRESAKKRKWHGNGTKKSPFIIESQDTNFRDICLIHTNLFVVIRNSKVIGLRIAKGQNITIQNCKINDLELVSSTLITISDSILYGRTRLIRANQITLRTSMIYYLIMSSSFNNTLSDCKIPDLRMKLSRENIFKGNELSDREHKKISQFLSKEVKSTLSALIIWIILLLSLVVLTILSSDPFMIGIISFFSVLIALTVIPLIKYCRKLSSVKKISPNEIS